MNERNFFDRASTVADRETTEPTNSSRTLAWTIAEAADDRKAADIVLLDVGSVCYMADYFAIATGYSKTQVRAIAESIEARVEDELGKKPLRVEGKAEGSWILLDYGDAIAHILLPTERDFYNLEAFWGHAERIEFSAASALGESS